MAESTPKTPREITVWIASTYQHATMLVLPSVGSLIDPETLTVYPAYTDWSPDLDCGTELHGDGCDEWWVSLSADDRDAIYIIEAKFDDRKD